MFSTLVELDAGAFIRQYENSMSYSYAIKTPISANTETIWHFHPCQTIPDLDEEELKKLSRSKMWLSEIIAADTTIIITFVSTT